jgi:hypothetical protein
LLVIILNMTTSSITKGEPSNSNMERNPKMVLRLKTNKQRCLW